MFYSSSLFTLVKYKLEDRSYVEYAFREVNLYNFYFDYRVCNHVKMLSKLVRKAPDYVKLLSFIFDFGP